MSKLFSGLRIGQLELSHRLVTLVRPEPRFEIVDYRRRTTPGGLLIIDESAELQVQRDHWGRVADAIHEAGGLAVMVLSNRLQQRHADTVEVEAAMAALQRAARFARRAGFDGVELDAGEGSLPDRFLQPQTNRREDDYGGDVERRMRFLLEATFVMAEECSSERVGVRLSPCSREGQLQIFAEVMRSVSERELAYIHLPNSTKQRIGDLGGHSVSIAACADRRAFRSDISCALIASDYCDVDVAASAVESRWADAIGFLQANDEPDFIVRLIRQQRER